jgi:uncharacterized protein YgiB involved in biofilm formation
MKRSNSIALIMMSASAIALTACEEPRVDAAVYDSVQQCIDDSEISKISPDQCKQQFAAASEQHAKVAPKYTSQADCEADFGAEQCENAPYQTRSGGSIFMPLMAGYMMGRMMGGRSGVASQPLYRSGDDRKNFRTADNRKVGSAKGFTTVARSATKAPSAKTSTTSRGGFGARARAGGSARS